jgi:hypothetical protein
MSRIVPIGLLVFMLPVAPDVTGYKLYYRDSANPVGGPLTHEDTSVPAVVTPLTGEDEGKGSIDLGTVDWSSGGIPNDSMIFFGVSAVDDVGNESDISQLPNPVPFDQEAPDAPTGLEFRPAS